MEQVKQLKGAYTGLPVRAQMAMVGVAIVTILVLFLVVRAATHTDWVPVQSDLKPGAAAKSSQALESAKIEHRVTSGGSVVEVPAKVENEATMALASAGTLDSGRVGYEIYDNKSGFKMGTSAEQKITYQRALEGQLARQIEELEGVEKADVGLVLPETVLFSSEQSKATASITLDTQGSSLEKAQVKAIQSLAAGRVKDLDQGSVTILDENANLLTGDGADSSSFTASQAKLEAENRYNRASELKLKNELEKIAGVGKVNVMFNAKLDLDEVMRRTHDVGGEDNEPGVVTSEDLKNEELNNPDTPTGGLTGLANNTTDNRLAGREAQDDASGDPIAAAARIDALDIPAATKQRLQEENLRKLGKAADPSFDSDQNTRTYDNDTVDEIVKQAPGAELKKGVAITVDSSVPADTQTAIEDAARAYLQINPEDTFAFGDAEFDKGEDLSKEKAAAERNAMLTKYGKWALLGLGMIGMAFFVRKSLNSRTDELLHPDEDMLLLEGGVQPIPLKELEAAVNAAGSLEHQKRHELQRKVEHIAANKPQDVALMLRGWMNDNAA